MSAKDLCSICGKPFPANTTRFLHFIGHIQAGEAVGRFDDKGNWWFSKSEMSDAQREVSSHIREQFDHGEVSIPAQEEKTA